MKHHESHLNYNKLTICRSYERPFSNTRKFFNSDQKIDITEEYYNSNIALSKADVTRQFLYPLYNQNNADDGNDSRNIICGRLCFKYYNKLLNNLSSS